MRIVIRRITAIRNGRRDRVASGAVSLTEPASLLYVCTANICRSPMAERLARAELSRRFGALPAEIAVSSAGVAARDGAPMDETAARTLHVLEADPAAFVARALAAEQVTDAALVLVAEREHRAVVARLVPRAVRRCFTVREFDRYLTTVDAAALPGEGIAARLTALVEQVNLHRGTLPPVGQDEDDLADPYLQGPEAMQACAEQLVGCITRWVALLAGAAQPQLAQIEEVDVGD